MVFYVPEDRRARLMEALARCPQVPFEFETQGTRLLLTPNEPL